MVRTQIYLDPQHKNLLALAANAAGTSRSDVVRAALNEYFGRHYKTKSPTKQDKRAMLDKVCGAWKDNDFDFRGLRNEANRLL